MNDEPIHIGDAANAVVRKILLAKLDEAIDSLRDVRTRLAAISAPRDDSATRKQEPNQ